MTPQEALAILDKATGMLQLNRADHVQIATAIRVLETALAKVKVESPLEEEQKLK